MKSSAIEREDVQVSEYPSMTGQLFTDTKVLLGYDPNVSLQDEQDKSRLMAVLQKAEIRPLKGSQVDHYKALQFFWGNLIWLRALVHLSVMASVAGIAHHGMKTGIDWASLIFAIFIAGVVTGAPIWAPRWYDWHERALRNYRKPVPEFALAYAVAIATEFQRGLLCRRV
jgi:hypothetical protein